MNAKPAKVCYCNANREVIRYCACGQKCLAHCYCPMAKAEKAAGTAEQNAIIAGLESGRIVLKITKA